GDCNLTAYKNHILPLGHRLGGLFAMPFYLGAVKQRQFQTSFLLFRHWHRAQLFSCRYFITAARRTFLLNCYIGFPLRCRPFGLKRKKRRIRTGYSASSMETAGAAAPDS
ncbi:hypothetical protein, partial [Paenibacillus solanacearum]|uniref:hypothetical protein n=1 Tax=Paenibacillus solanacearum TaxID=2048548 RepID=UPI001C408305